MSNIKPLLLIAGPCVIEDETLTLDIARDLAKQLKGLNVDFYFKASFDKANRSSIEGFRGPGMEQGLKILERVKRETGLRVVTDFHTPDQAERVAEVVDFLQIPAFLCRQTDMIFAGANAALNHGRKLNVKKGQFLAPWDAKNIVAKLRESEVLWTKQNPGKKVDAPWFWLTERGVSFGYNHLVVDMASFQEMQRFDVPVIYDATHSVQMPGAGPGGKSTGGHREWIEVLARAAVSAGTNGIFLECHPEPSKAKSDGPNAFYLDKVGEFVKQLIAIRELTQAMPKLLPESGAR
jgi:2-dehydro-3-deoxyphosphooctonate aldolase (KDO 8-P synthase)